MELASWVMQGRQKTSVSRKWNKRGVREGRQAGRQAVGGGGGGGGRVPLPPSR
jgi:hypothetical protein